MPALRPSLNYVQVAVSLALGASLMAVPTASGAAPHAQDMPLGPAALPPVAFVEFCARQPADCGPADRVLADVARARYERAELNGEQKGSLPVFAPSAVLDEPLGKARAPRTPAVAAMTPSLWASLNRVNAAVNRRVIRRTDREAYGVDDHWTTPPLDGKSFGDCEDFALDKRRELVAAGVPLGALSLGIVETRTGEAHAVLLVRSSEGEFVLDNLTPVISPWQTTPYRWIRRQVDGGPFEWAMVASAATAMQGS